MPQRRPAGPRRRRTSIIKTVPRRGYIFDAEVVGGTANRRPVWLLGAAVLATSLAIAIYVVSLLARRAPAVQDPQQQLTRLTFNPGLQTEPTWSPDARLVAYSADSGGNFDIWVKPASGGNAVPLTTSLAHDWQPDWSPDGSRIAYRSERDGGGLYVVPALGGPERKISPFGFRPRWSPDGSQVLFARSDLQNVIVPSQVYVVGLDGRPPREILADTVADFRGFRAAWHPDGRVSLWGEHRLQGQSFWTVRPATDEAIRSDVAEAVAMRLRDDSAPQLSQFFWAPSADALYFEGLSRGVRNLWKMRVDPKTLRWVAGPERLTIGPGPDRDAALSRDGKRLAYTTRRETVRFWHFPFDATGVALGEGRPLTSEELNVVDGELSPDGLKLVFGAERIGRSELWERSVEDGTERLLAADGFARAFPRWSRDSRRFAYLRSGPGSTDPKVVEHSLVVLPSGGGEEQVLTSAHASVELPSDWSLDGNWVLASTNRGASRRYEICLIAASAAPRAEIGRRVLVSDPELDLWHARLSPDGSWVSFHSVDLKRRLSNVHARRAEGGPWVPITAGEAWNGKARWSNDGRALFFLSNRTGLFEIWSVRFDPVVGRTVGQPFKVSRMEGNGRGISLAGSPPPGLSFAAGRLVVPLKEVSGSVWMLESARR